MSTQRICLITPGHIASTPRLVKEADALAEAGYAVHVVAGRHFPPADALDARILDKGIWPCTRVDDREGASLARKILRHAARKLFASLPVKTLKAAALAHHAETLRLARAASRIPADLYVGHCLAGLPAAALAARSRGVPYGFDAEDFHDAETEDNSENPGAREARHYLQKTLLPGCAHLTAASPCIAEKFSEIYNVNPLTVLNVFPLSEAPGEPAAVEPTSESRPARLYWFSQTVGEGRGLEEIVAILGKMRTPVELQLRGFASAEFRSRLGEHAVKYGLRRRIVFLEPGPPDQMARLAAEADLGLSIELAHPLNRDICLTNKVFIYLLAGIPQLLTDTTAQSRLAPELGGAALLCHLGETEKTAETLDRFFSDLPRREAAHQTARTLARGRFCWDIEKARFLDSIHSALPRTSSPH